MSYTQLFYARSDGEMFPAESFQNAFLGSMLLWEGMAVKYGILAPDNDSPAADLLTDPTLLQRVWRLAAAPAVPYPDRLALATTFDRVLVPRKQFVEVARSMEQASDWIGRGNHLAEQAACLRIRSEDPHLMAAGWQQTSVAQCLWWVYQDEEDEEGRPYDIVKDNRHIWIAGLVRPGEESVHA